MIVEETKLEGCFTITPKVFQDDRGYFFESFNLKEFNKQTSKNIEFVQENESFSLKGVIRGLHFQTGKFAQAKLVRVIKGAVLDVAVDIRPKSKTFGQYISVELTEFNKKQLFLPRDFAHGFAVLSESAIFSYKCDNYYNKDSEAGIIYNDSFLDIDWKTLDNKTKLSEKDLILPTFEDYFK